jgi:hypothetical protein
MLIVQQIMTEINNKTSKNQVILNKWKNDSDSQTPYEPRSTASCSEGVEEVER